MTRAVFPHLRVGTFIEAVRADNEKAPQCGKFPHLRVGTFIEAQLVAFIARESKPFPHLRVGTFIEANYNAGTEQKGTISPPSGGDFH